MNSIQQSFKVEYRFNIHYTEDLFSSQNTLLFQSLEKGTDGFCKKILVFFDENLVPHHPNLEADIVAYFQPYQNMIQLVCSPIAILGNEQVKIDRVHLDYVLKMINQYGIDRHSYCMAIGGGALLDMVGYASAIAHRGIRLIRVPTTLLSQDDSGVGVKNSINYFGKKNFLGTFAPPYAVFNDYHFIQSLSTSDYRCGLAEAIKVSLIKDKEFYHFLSKNADQILAREKEIVQQVIYKCALLHSQHIASGDPFEMGSSRPLDFGHWAAHKLEQISNHDIKHGDAVACGLALDIYYSYLLGYISSDLSNSIMALLLKFGFKIFYPQLLYTNNQGHSLILEGLQEFREHLGGNLTIMLLKEIGKGIEVHEMNTDFILQSIQQLQKIQENHTHARL
jgi:3-dehydroquinate synthase